MMNNPKRLRDRIRYTRDENRAMDIIDELSVAGAHQRLEEVYAVAQKRVAESASVGEVSHYCKYPIFNTAHS